MVCLGPAQRGGMTGLPPTAVPWPCLGRHRSGLPTLEESPPSQCPEITLSVANGLEKL